MAEQSIEVGYAPLGGGYFHKFIIYTDAGGNEWIARGGPTGDTPAQGFVSEVTQAQAGNADQWGNIRTEVEPYAYGAQDYVPRLGDPNYNANNLPHDRETIVRGGDLTEAWEKIQEEMTRINSAGYKYKPVTQNSNTVVDDALDYAGLPQPQDDNRGEHLAPGSGHRFPKRLGGRGGRIAGAAAPAFYKAEGTPYKGDPVLIDLNGDGIKTTTVLEGQFFDHDGNGFAELSAWVDSNDGILAIDKNSNGTIDNGNEIFGNNTILSNSSTATDGYAALADLDSNSDGVINSSDTLFSQLRVLKGDGTLLTLTQAGIQSLSLSHSSSNTVDANGNTLVSLGSYTKIDTTTGLMGDYKLLADTANSDPLTTVALSPTIASLPNLQGSGNVYDLQQAMEMDTSGTLQGLVEDFIASTTEASRNSLIEQILDQWSGVSVSGTRNGGFLLADHASVMEKFEGHYFDGDSNSFIGTVPAAFLSQGYYQLGETLYGQLMLTTQLTDQFNEINLVPESNERRYCP